MVKNYFYKDEFGIIHGTEQQEVAEKHGAFIESDVACMHLNKKGTKVGGYPIFEDNIGPHQVIINTEDKSITVDGALARLHELPVDIQGIAKELGF